MSRSPMDGWFSRGALLAAPVVAVMGLAGCDSEPSPEAVAAAMEAAEQVIPVRTAAPLSPAIFDMSTTVSQIENVFADERPVAETVPHALAVRAGAEAYLDSVPEERRATVAPHVEAIRTLVDQLVAAAGADDQRGAHEAMERLRDDHVRVLREMEQVPQRRNP